MREYCDPPSGTAEWHEERQSWSEAHPVEELCAFRELEAAVAKARRKQSSPLKPNALGKAFLGKAFRSTEEEFSALVVAWREATSNLSSLTKIVEHPSYQRIIELGMRGEPVVPLILRDLREHGGYWALALSAITGENPVSSKHIGNPARVREDWIAWGLRHGHL